MSEVKEMMCGACGAECFSLRSDNNKLITECSGCGSTTVISITTPKLSLDWGENSEGILSEKYKPKELI